MKRTSMLAAMALIATQAMVAAQGKDVKQVLADTRAALGGDKIASVKTLIGEGRTLRTNQAGATMENEFEMSMMLPDKYLMHSVVAAMGNMSIFRNTGFNGGQVIEEIDRPPNLSGGNVIIRIAGPGGAAMDPAKMTPEQKVEADRLRLTANRKEYAKLMLGMFAASPEVYPLQFSYGGEAESADGKADVIDVKGEDGFAVRMFVDQKTHLPLMLSWMDKEPLMIQSTTRGGAGSGEGGGTVVKQFSSSGGGGGVVGGMPAQHAGGGGGGDTSVKPTQEQLDKMQKDFEEQRKEAEAKRRVVEYRVYYTEYQNVGGVKLPFKIQKAIDGKTTEEMVFDTLKLNSKIDAKKFEVSK